MKAEPLSSDFLADLRAITPYLQGQAASWAQFRADLALVHACVLEEEGRQALSDRDFSFLDDRLGVWRANAQKELGSLISSIPKDDPLRCPISLFGTMDYGRLETAHTRALGWLLDRKKEHGFGDTLLQALLEKVTGRSSCVECTYITCESPLKEGDKAGRIDIYAEGHWIKTDGQHSPWLLMLEAKVDAWEGDSQLERYEVSLKQSGREPVRVFLTPAGRQAETASNEWTVLSFQELAEAFRGVMDKLQDEPGYHFLRFYLAGVLKDVCSWPIPIKAECDDPYSVLSYMKSIRN